MFKLKANKEFKSKLKNRILEEYKDFNLINVKDTNGNSFATGFNINIDFLDRLQYNNMLSAYFISTQSFQNIEELLNNSDCPESVLLEKIMLTNESLPSNSFLNSMKNDSYTSTKALDNALKYAERIIIKSVKSSEFISRVLEMKGKELFIEIYQENPKDFMKFGLFHNNKMICVVEFNCSLLSFQEKNSTLDFTIQIANINKGRFSFFDNCFKDTVEEKMLRKSVNSYRKIASKFYFKNKKITVNKYINSTFEKSIYFMNSKTIEYNYIFNMIISDEFNQRILIGNEDEKQMGFEDNYFIDLISNVKFINILHYLDNEFRNLKSKKVKFYFKIDIKLENYQIIIDDKDIKPLCIYIDIEDCKPIEKIPLSFDGKETMFYISDFVEHGREIIEYIKMTQY